jgi:hypothetical protein
VRDQLGVSLLVSGGTAIQIGGILALSTTQRRDAEEPPGKDRFLYR